MSRANLAENGLPILLSVVELGGYPNFASLYKGMGFEVIVEGSVRKALKLLKKTRPKVVVAEFNFQSDFRDRTSNLESLLAVTQGMPETQVIVFYELEFLNHLEKLTDRFSIQDTLAFPIQMRTIETALERMRVLS